MDDIDRICARSAKCPIYSGILGSKEVLIHTYKDLYCENGKEGREKCKRYQVAEITGACPPGLLPNSRLSVEDVIKNMSPQK
jgi:hypothetical protein